MDKISSLLESVFY